MSEGMETVLIIELLDALMFGLKVLPLHGTVCRLMTN